VTSPASADAGQGRVGWCDYISGLAWGASCGTGRTVTGRGKTWEVPSSPRDSIQHRRQEVFTRGALRSCGGALRLCPAGLKLKSWWNLQWFIVFHISIWGGLVLCLWVLSPSNTSRGDGTDSIPAFLLTGGAGKMRKINDWLNDFRHTIFADVTGRHQGHCSQLREKEILC